MFASAARSCGSRYPSGWGGATSKWALDRVVAGLAENVREFGPLDYACGEGRPAVHT